MLQITDHETLLLLVYPNADYSSNELGARCSVSNMITMNDAGTRGKFVALAGAKGSRSVNVKAE